MILYIGQTPSAEGAGPFVEEMATFAEVGISRAIVMPIGPDPSALVDDLGAQVIPELAKL